MKPSRALVHARRGARICAGVAVLAVLGGCAAQLGSMAPNDDMLLPHSVLIKPAPLDLGTFDVSVYKVYKGAVADTAEQPFTKVVMSERDVPGQSARAVVLSQWGPPLSRMDSLVVDTRGLEPLDEEYVVRGVRYRYSFDGPRVSGTVRRPHAAPQRIDETFDEPVFALNEVGPLVCSLDDYHAGMTEIVPVFSEASGTLQRDTLSVLRRETLPGRAPGWVVRFAAPASTTDYVVDASTRQIVDAVTTRRSTGAEMRYQYPAVTG